MSVLLGVNSCFKGNVFSSVRMVVSCSPRFFCTSNSNSNSNPNPFPPIPKEGNVPLSIKERVGTHLYLKPNHPIKLIKDTIENHFHKTYIDPVTQKPIFAVYDKLFPEVSIKSNFDDLLFPSTHIGRSPNDTYYISDSKVLRTHTSAHQNELIRKGEKAFLAIGETFRRDSIDAFHFPIFHQMEGVRTFGREILNNYASDFKEQGEYPVDWYYESKEYKSLPEVKFVENDLKSTLEGLIKSVFGDVQVRWSDSYFPFTSPSWEMEVLFNGEWLEIFGCGVIHPTIMKRAHEQSSKVELGERGWAFGLGLERLAMVLFDIPDIRLFWGNDSRFLDQFKAPFELGKLKFKPYSKYPICFKDITFWIPSDYHENKFYELVRNEAADLVESVQLIDKFTHPKTNKESHCYRVNYRSMERNLTNDEIDKIQAIVRKSVVDKLGVELR